MTAVNEAFGDFDTFINLLKSTLAGVYGPGWVWLAYNKETGGLEIVPALNEDSLILKPDKPLVPLLNLNFWVDSHHMSSITERPENYYDMW